MKFLGIFYVIVIFMLFNVIFLTRYLFPLIVAMQITIFLVCLLTNTLVISLICFLIFVAILGIDLVLGRYVKQIYES